ANQAATVTAALNGASATDTITIQAAATLGAAYTFDEGAGATTADASGNGNTGQITGAVWTSTAKYGKALSFDGNSDYVDLGNPAALQTAGSMTWSAWIYVTGKPSGDDEIMARSDGNNGWQFMTTFDCGPRTIAVGVSGDGSTLTERCGHT